MTEALYYVSQLFLVIGAVTTIGIIHLTSQLTPPFAWYYYVAMWGTGMMCALIFSQPYLYHIKQDLSPAQYGLRIAFGVEHLAIWIYYRYKVGKPFSISAIQKTNYLVAGLVFLLLVSALGIGLFNAILKNREETTKLRREIKASVASVVPKKLEAVRVTIEGLRKDLHAKDSIILELTRELERTRAQLTIVTGQLGKLGTISKELQRSVKSLDSKAKNQPNSSDPVLRTAHPLRGPKTAPLNREVVPETNRERRKRLRVESSSFVPARDSLYNDRSLRVTLM